MDEVRVPRKELTKKPIVFTTGGAQLIVVQRPCVHAIDVEDTHFAHDRCILLPDIAEADGSTPTLDERRLTGLGVIYAALAHAENHPEQKVLVVGHTDPSGAKSYNQELSEKRAKNVQLFISGKRDDWAKHADKESHPDDVQHILAFQAQRAGWDCDPGTPTGKMDAATKAAIGRFQERYNAEVDRAKNDGLDLPFKAKIAVDKDIGPKTWGAIFDAYCFELMRLLGLEAFAELQPKLAAMKGFDGAPLSVGCGENIPFESGRRAPFEPDEKLDRPQHNPSDRRVEILFFDAEEKPDLKCHAGGGCKPAVCPLYTKEEYCHIEIGVPRGLKIGEVVMELRFEDPEGNTHLLPAGLEVEVRFDDGSTETHVLLENGRVSFVTARDKSSFDLALTAEDANYIVLVPGADGAAATTELLARDAALEKMNEGARFLLIPKAFDTHDADWRVPDDVAFVEGRFIDLDSPATQIGTRQAPAAVVLVPRWQHLKLQYFDRWRSKPATVPQPRPRKDGTPSLVLEGHLAHVDYTTGPSDPPVAESVWDVEVEGETLHCLAWVHRRPSDAAPRELPDKDCLTRFVFPAGTYVRVDGAADAEAPDRIVETIADGHEHFEEASKAGAARLRYYDLPEQWWSRGYFTRLASQDASATRCFQDIADNSSKDAPYLIDLDQIVLCMYSTPDPGSDEKELKPRPQLTWKDVDTDRFTIWDQSLKAHQAHKDEPYFTDVTKLSPVPQGPVLVDHAPFTRLVTRGKEIFDVFAGRSPILEDFKDLPIGARVATRYLDPIETPFFSINPSYIGIEANDTKGSDTVGDAATIVMRCCGHKDDTEYFRVAQYAAALFDFAPKTMSPHANGTVITPPVAADKALDEIRKSLIASAKRWNGDDMTNQVRAMFEVGPKDTPEAIGLYHALLVRGHDGSGFSHHYRIDILDNQRAFMLRHAAWKRTDMQPGTGGSFTAAHEWGHAFGNPDHYIERWQYASLDANGIDDRFRSPGCPYSFDAHGLMNQELQKPRGYDLWHLALWMADAGHSFAGRKDIAIRQGIKLRYTTEITPRDKNRALFPVVSKVDQKVGASGLCDLFAYCGGVDGFNGGDGLPGATPEAPWDMVVIVRVKLALTLGKEHEKFEDGGMFVVELQEIIDRVFNGKIAPVARGTFEGRAVSALFRFSPRFVSRTYPKGDSDTRTKYIKSLKLPKDKAKDYTAKVTDIVSTSRVHCEVTAVKKPASRGITNATASPRTASIDTRTLEADVVDVFGKLVGLRDPARATANDYAPLANLLGPGFARTSLELLK